MVAAGLHNINTDRHMLTMQLKHHTLDGHHDLVVQYVSRSKTTVYIATIWQSGIYIDRAGDPTLRSMLILNTS